MGNTHTEQERAEFLHMHADFESAFGPMPPNCTWTGRGFCQTAHNAWKAQEYADKFDGFKVAWQAARRAQVVPLPSGWCAVPVHLTSQMREDAMHYHLRFASFDLDDLWRDLLGAAPQPTEAAPAAAILVPDTEQAVLSLLDRIENACKNRALAAGGSIVACGLVESKRAGIEQQLRQLLATQNKAPRAGAATHAGGNPAQT